MTQIEWTDRVWNPVTGCTKVSPGCDHCYAEGIARRFAGTASFPQGFEITPHPDRVTAPLRWRNPSRVFVNSMSDLFHDAVPAEYIARIWSVMAATPQHTYQILTKRHGRMRSLLNDAELRASMWEGCVEFIGEHAADQLWDGRPDVPWPLPNVWVGVSVEDQQRADLRIPALMETPAAIRFLSCEPLIGPVELNHLHSHCPTHDFPGGFCVGPCPDRRWPDWVIVGGESGPSARPLDVEWVRSLAKQCERAEVPVFVKQLGSKYGPHKGGDMSTWPEDLRIRQFPKTEVSA